MAALFVVLLGVIGIWLFGYVLVALLRGLIKGDPVVMIDDDGFSLPAGLERRQPERVYWKDVKDIWPETSRFRSAIVVQLTEHALARKTPSLWQSIDLRFVSGQVIVPATFADRSGKEIEALMREHWLTAH